MKLANHRKLSKETLDILKNKMLLVKLLVVFMIKMVILFIVPIL